MITPSFSTTATERVLPRMALDFTTGVLDPRVTVTRALDTATRVNASGFIETVNANLPRFDYDPVTLAAKGLLIEETRANLLLQSEEFGNAPWVPTNQTVTPNSTTSPSNTATADTLNEGTGTGSHNIGQNFSSTSGVSYAFSAYFKNGDARYLQLFFGGGGHGFNAFANFDLQTGTVGTVGSSATASIVNAGNGWYRCVIVAAATATTVNASVQIAIVRSSTSARAENFTGTNKFIYAWGAQLEAGAFPTSYIPTTTTSLTRNADVVSMTGTNFSDWWHPTTGGMSMRARQSIITGVRPWAYISDGTADNIISLRGNVANPELYIKATTDQAQIDAGTLTSNTSYGLSGAWGTNDCAAALNGGAAATDTSATIPTVDRMLIGSDGTNYLSGWAEKISYWPQRITNAETQAFSK